MGPRKLRSDRGNRGSRYEPHQMSRKRGSPIRASTQQAVARPYKKPRVVDTLYRPDVRHNWPAENAVPELLPPTGSTFFSLCTRCLLVYYHLPPFPSLTRRTYCSVVCLVRPQR